MGYIPTRLIASNSMAGFRRELKKIIKCIVVSAKVITVDQLDHEFMLMEGRPIPYNLLRFKTLKAYVESLWDIFSVDPKSGIISLENMDIPGLGKSAHIRKLVLNREDDEADCFVHPIVMPKTLPPWNIMDIINQSPDVDFKSQLNIVVYLNRNKGGLTVNEFKTGILSVLEIRSVKRSFGSIEKLLEKIQHFIRISGGRIYPHLDIYSAEIRDLGLDPYYVPQVAIIPDSVKRRIVEILDGESHGMFAQYLPEKYEERYGFPLDYWTLGFPTVTQLLGTIPEVVRMYRFGGYFLIYNAKHAYPPEPGVPTGTVQNILKMLALFEEGVDLQYFQETYRTLWNEPLVIEPLGFESLVDTLATLTGDGIVMEKDGLETYVKLQTRSMASAIPIVRPFIKKNIDALPSGFYPSWVLGPHDKVPRLLHLDKELKPGAVLDVEMQAIYGPGGFFVNVKDGYCTQMQDEINAYYMHHADSYAMPVNACVEGQFCIQKLGSNYLRVLIISEGFLPYSVSVLAIDYGYVHNVDLDNEYLYFLHKVFADIPNQAIFCYVPNIEPPNFLLDFTAECIKMFTSLVAHKTLQARVYKVNHGNLEMAVFLNDLSSGESVDIRRVLIDNFHGNVTFKRPRCKERLYSVWTLYMRMPST